MANPPSSARDAVRGTVPKMIEVAEQVIYGDIWERPGLSKRDRSLIVNAIPTDGPTYGRGCARRSALKQVGTSGNRGSRRL